jgi:LPS export ABC transporter protein LptC
MKKKTLAQIFFLIIIVVLVFFIYNKYFSDKKLKKNSTKITQIKKEPGDKEKSNIVYNIKYTSYNSNGGKYIVTADRGKIFNKDKNLTLMENVNATIVFKETAPINFRSNEAVYNNMNYTTEFYGDVLMTYMEHDIKSDKLSLNFSKNLATISNNVFYKNLNTSLKADRIRVNLLTKDTNIYMKDKSNKIKVISKN